MSITKQVYASLTPEQRQLAKHNRYVRRVAIIDWWNESGKIGNYEWLVRQLEEAERRMKQSHAT